MACSRSRSSVTIHAATSFYVRPWSAAMRLEPLLDLEEDHEADEGQHLAADAKAPERNPAGYVADHVAEVLAEEPGDEAERQEDRGYDGELFADFVLPVGHYG